MKSTLAEQDYLLDAGRKPEEDSSEPKISDWRFGMTTCIAAITGRQGLDGEPDVIVTASDTRVSFDGAHSADGTIKLHMFYPNWLAMIAGSDTTQYVPVLDRARKLLDGKPGTLPAVMSAFKKAYQEQLREVMTDDLLSRYGMTIEDFKKRGIKQLHPEIFTEISLKMKIYNLGCTFLVYGLDNQKTAHIFTVRNPGKAENYDKPGFWAIGNGARSALTMLSALKQVRGRTPFPATIYNVLASKYFSEAASDVGDETYLWIQRYGSLGFSLNRGLEENIRLIWESEGQPKINPNAIRTILEAEIEFTPEIKQSKQQTPPGRKSK